METFQVGDWRVTPSLDRVERGGNVRHLEPRVMDLLVFLAGYPGEVIGKDRLIQAIWPDTFVTEHSLTHSIRLLRQVLDDDARRPRYLETIPRRGYRLIARVGFESPGEPGKTVRQGSPPPPPSADDVEPVVTRNGRVVLRLVRQDPAEARSPYPGLAPFTENDAAVFFGRTSEIRSLWERLREGRLLAVIGSSGAGKTSFLRAGVIPGRPAGWGAIYLTPGGNPALSLARALTPELSGEQDAVKELLDGLSALAQAGDPGRMIEAVSRWRQRHAECLLVVDQFEELFTLNPTQRQASFAALLASLADEAGIRVLISLRDDFLVRCCEQPPLAPILDGLTVLLGPTRDGLRLAMTEPARLLGYRFEDDALVEEIVAAVEGVRGSLPLLAFAVSQLWENRDPDLKVLTSAAYREIGGVEGALARHAEATLHRIGASREPLVREIFRNLVTAQGTRAAMDRQELLSIFDDRKTAEEVIRLLVNARLLTTYEVEGKIGEESRHRIEMVHESLLRAWPRLLRWQAQDEEGAVLRGQLRQAAHLWEEKGRPPDLLWTGMVYREYLLWKERYPGTLTKVEQDFGKAMSNLEERRRHRRHLAVGGAFVLLLLVLGVIATLLRQTDEALDLAVEEEQHALASKLVALGRLELEHYPSAALAYARLSLETADTVEGRMLALQALWAGAAARFVPVPGTTACRVAYSRDGHRLAVSGFGSVIEVLSETGVVSRIEGLPTVADPRGVVFDLSGRLLSFAVRDPLLRRFDLKTGRSDTLPLEAEWVGVREDGHILALGAGPSGPEERAVSVVAAGSDRPETVWRWRPDWDLGVDFAGMRAPAGIDLQGEWLAFGRERRVFLQRIGRAGRGDFLLGEHTGKVRALAFSRSRERLVSVDETGELKLWSIPDGRQLRSARGPEFQSYSRPSFDLTGSMVSWVSGSGRCSCVWELDGPPSAPVRCFYQDSVEYGGTDFHPDGTWLAAADSSRVAVWLLAAPHSRILGHHSQGPILDLAFSPDGSTLASAARDGTRLWPIKAGAGEPRRVSLPREHFAYGLAWVPSGRDLVISAPTIGVYRVPAAGGPEQLILPYPANTMALGKAAVDVAGRSTVIASHYSARAEDLRLYLVDLFTGRLQTLPLRDEESTNPWKGAARSVAFTEDGRVLFSGDGGVRRWDPVTGVIDQIMGGPGEFAVFAADRPGNRIVVETGKASDTYGQIREARLWTFDLKTGMRQPITSHGNRLSVAVAMDPSGQVIVTGDADGAVRVGPADGGEPHLLLGHSGPVRCVAVSPDRRWVASAAGAEIRLWPMPDLDRIPLHTLPHDEMLTKLRTVTNLEVIPDEASPSGYRLNVGPFPGWREVPIW